MLLIQTTVSNQLEIDISDDSIISDYFVNGTNILKLNSYSNWRFYINALIDTKYYKRFLNVTRTHVIPSTSSYGIFSMTAKFHASNQSLTRSYNVTNCKTLKVCLSYS